MRFEWHENKATANLDKHRVSFNDAVLVFDDPLRLEFIDEKHSTPMETRYATIGLSKKGLLYVVFMDVTDDIIRIIHARIADPRMVKLYEERKRD